METTLTVLPEQDQFAGQRKVDSETGGLYSEKHDYVPSKHNEFLATTDTSFPTEYTEVTDATTEPHEKDPLLKDGETSTTQGGVDIYGVRSNHLNETTGKAIKQAVQESETKRLQESETKRNNQESKTRRGELKVLNFKIEQENHMFLGLNRQCVEDADLMELTEIVKACLLKQCQEGHNGAIESTPQGDKKDHWTEKIRVCINENYVPWAHWSVYFSIYSCTIAFGAVATYYSFAFEMYSTITISTIDLGILLIVGWLCGNLKTYYPWVRAGYTRKTVHFSIFLIPYLIDYLFASGDKGALLLSTAYRFFMYLIWTITYTWPIRYYIPFFRTSLRASDRPEDRPNSLLWISWQVLGTNAVITPFQVLWAFYGTMHMGFIPIVITGLGDGLAEPVGLSCGKHKYKATACCTEKQYTRSLEGSATVACAGYLVICALFWKFETVYEWLVNLILVPPIMTLVEAYSPHTLDNPLLYLVGSLIPTLVHMLPGLGITSSYW